MHYRIANSIKSLWKGSGGSLSRKGSPSRLDADGRYAAGGIVASWKTPLKKGFSKPFPKLFGLPLLRNGSRCFVVLDADLIIEKFDNLF